MLNRNGKVITTWATSSKNIRGNWMISRRQNMKRLKKTEKIKKVIDKWDPIGLLAIGAPKDEYDFEITKISNQIINNGDVEKVAEIIQKIFIDMFDEETFNKTFDECKEIAREILK